MRLDFIVSQNVIQRGLDDSDGLRNREVHVGVTIDMTKLRALAGESAPYLLGGIPEEHDYVIVETNDLRWREDYSFWKWGQYKKTLELAFEHGRLALVKIGDPDER